MEAGEAAVLQDKKMDNAKDNNGMSTAVPNSFAELDMVVSEPAKYSKPTCHWQEADLLYLDSRTSQRDRLCTRCALLGDPVMSGRPLARGLEWSALQSTIQTRVAHDGKTKETGGSEETRWLKR